MMHCRTIFTLVLASIPIFHAAAPLTAESNEEMEANNQSNNEQHERHLQLFNIDLAALLGPNATCPTDCPLCQCLESTNSTEAEDASCLYSASIEACASKSLESCYASLLPGDFDIEGLCSVQCDKPEEEIPSTLKEVCRICDIFACCNDCPSEMADRCFPPGIEDGYTPMGWKPASCGAGDGSGASRRGIMAGGYLILFVAFAVLTVLF